MSTWMGRVMNRRVLRIVLLCILVAAALALVPGLGLGAASGQTQVGASGPARCQLLCQLPATSPGVLFVDWEATGANDGSSWDDAFVDLQLALDAALPGDEIWVAAGTYYPSVEHGGTGPRYQSFQMLNGVGIYGGFDPTVGDVGWEDRDWVANETILSGDIGTPGNANDNCYHVFYHPEELALDDTAILDGFTVSDGNAEGNGPHSVGGGMYNVSSSPAIVNCHFEQNWAGGGGGVYNEDSEPAIHNSYFAQNWAYDGGGMFNSFSSPMLTAVQFVGNYSELEGAGMYNAGSTPTLMDCVFTQNWADDRGGGMYNANSSPVLTGCTFTGNEAWDFYQWGSGGGMYNSSSHPVLVDCVFIDNLAGDVGGGMRNSGSNPVLVDCVFLSNSGQMGGGMDNGNSSPELTNCIFAYNGAYGWPGFGGGMANAGGAPKLTNCTFYGNSAGSGGAIHISYAEPTIVTNSILWGNSPDEITGSAVVTFSDIQGGFEGEGNIDQDPVWVDPENGDFHLTTDSSCIDSGTNDAPDLPPTDFEGDPRIMDGDADGVATVDMGVDEVPGPEPEPITGLVSTNDSPTVLGSATTLTATVVTGNYVTYTWALGDGSYDSGDVVVHTYPAVGIYTAVVTAANSVSQQEAETIATIIDETIQGLEAANDSPTVLGSPTTLMATVSAGSNISYTWAFGDGTFGSVPLVTHVYPAADEYTAVVTATNSVSWAWAETLVNVDEVIEGLVAANDSPTVLGSPTTLMATVSAGSNVNYTWGFGDGTFGSGPLVTHIYPSIDEYTAFVTANNSVSWAWAETLVTIIPAGYQVYLPVVLRNH